MAPAWFEFETYFKNKLAQYGGTAEELQAAFEEAGYPCTEDGLYQHFVDYGDAENVSPNAFFDAEYYFQSKADLEGKTVDEMKAAFAEAGLSAWDHYILYGAAEGVNPSADFDTDMYLDAKLALTDDDFDGSKADLCKALAEAGLNPIMHYELYGKGEGIEASDFDPTPGPGPEPPGPEPPAPTEADPYTNKANYTTQYIWADDRGEIKAESTDTRFVALEDQLTSQQVIDGGDGHDMLDITLGTSTTAGNIVGPILTGIEDVRIKAQQSNTANNGDNLPSIQQYDVPAEERAAQLDAGDIDGMTRVWSSNSRADVIVEDVRTDSNELTNVFQNADPGDVDFEVYIDPQHLKATGASSSTSGSIEVELIDVYHGSGKATDELVGPLVKNPFDIFNFYYTPNGSSEATFVSLDLGATGKALNGTAANYSTLLAAFQAALKTALGELGFAADAVTAEMGSTFTDNTYMGKQSYTATGSYILLKTAKGEVAVKDADGNDLQNAGWGVSSGVMPVTGGIVWDAENESETAFTCPLIVTDIWLDNVARVNWIDLETSDQQKACLPNDVIYGSQAGEMVVGSMAARGGVERFDVTVDRGSWLSSLRSTNEALRMVKVVNGDVIDDEDGNDASDNGVGNLFIGQSLVDADSYDELGYWADPATFLSTDGLVDVAIFDGSEFEGIINIGASITEASNDKYLKDVDGSWSMKHWAPLSGYGDLLPRYDACMAYLLGENDDVLNMEVNSSIANDNDFAMLIDGGDGDDTIAFAFDLKNLLGLGETQTKEVQQTVEDPEEVEDGQMAVKNGDVYNVFEIKAFDEETGLKSGQATDGTYLYNQLTAKAGAELPEGQFADENGYVWNQKVVENADGLAPGEELGDACEGGYYVVTTEKVLVYDADGKPVFEPVYDMDGNPTYYPNGDPAYSQKVETISTPVKADAVPNLDSPIQGDPVIEIETSVVGLPNEIGNQIVGTAVEGMAPGVVVADLASVQIDGGNGDDTVYLNGWGSVVVQGGNGDDVIYNNDGGDRAVWMVNTDATDPFALAVEVDPVNGAQPLDNSALSTYNEQVEVSAAAKFTEVRALVEYMGITSYSAETLKVDKAASATLYESDINKLIISAVNDDGNSMMNNILEAKDGAGYALILESLIPGDHSGDAAGLTPQITIEGKDASGKWVALNWDSSDYKPSFAYDYTGWDGVTPGYEGEELTGSDGVVVSNNIIDAGRGYNMIVLGTNAGGTQTIEVEVDMPYEKYYVDTESITFENGGSHDIVRFSDDGVVAGGEVSETHILNFTVSAGEYQADGEDLLDFTGFFDGDNNFAGFTGGTAFDAATGELTGFGTLTGSAKGVTYTVTLSAPTEPGHVDLGIEADPNYVVPGFKAVASTNGETIGTLYFSLIDTDGAVIDSLEGVDVVAQYYGDDAAGNFWA